MFNNTLVSIIIPTYQRPSMLKKALESCINQTHKNLEVLVIDNNEFNDQFQINTTQVVKEIDDERIQLFCVGADYNAVQARNYGIKISKGKFINFLDDDDELYLTKISKQLDLFHSSNVELSIIGGFADIYQGDKLIRIEKNEIRGNVLIDHYKSNLITTSIGLFNADTVKKTNGFMDIPSAQEYMFILEMLRTNPNYDYVEEPLVKINQHSGPRISNQKNKAIGAIKAWETVSRLINNLDETQKKEIRRNHLVNISVSYSTAGQKYQSIRYLGLIIREIGFFNTHVFKLLLLNILGLKMYSKLLNFRWKWNQ